MNIQKPTVQIPVFPSKQVSIADFGAVADGVTMNTQAINNAIDAVSAAGGGTVLIPAGYWKTASIVLKDGVELRTEAGTFVKFSGDWRDYPLIHSHFEGMPTARCLSPIYAKDASNIAITGDGIFDGAGENWRVCKKWKFTEPQWEALLKKPGVYCENTGKETLIWPSQAAAEGSKYNNRHGGMVDNLEEAEQYRVFFRPVMVNLVGCRRVYLQGITFQNSPAWCLHPRMCDDLTMDHVSMRNPWYAQNGDALDLEAAAGGRATTASLTPGMTASASNPAKTSRDGRRSGPPRTSGFTTASSTTATAALWWAARCPAASAISWWKTAPLPAPTWGSALRAAWAGAALWRTS